MLFNKKIIVEEKDINEGYKEYLNNTDIILLCVDTLPKFEEVHIKGAQCFPYRSIKKYASDQLPKDAIYYVYAIRHAEAYNATKDLLRLGFDAYCLGSSLPFKGPEERKNKRLRL